MKIILTIFILFTTLHCSAQLEYKVKKKPVMEESAAIEIDSVEDLDADAKKLNWYSKDIKRVDTNKIVIELSNKVKDTMYLSIMPIKIGDMLGFRIDGYRSLAVHCEITIINPTTNTTYKAPSDNGYIMDNTANKLMKLDTVKQEQAVISDFYYKNRWGQAIKLNKTLVILP